MTMNLLFSLRQAVEDRTDEAQKRAACAAVVKAYRAEALEAAKQKLYRERRGLPVMYFLSDKTDEMFAVLTHFVCSVLFDSEQDSMPAVVACGGYGRRELAPFSDIDILFLIDENASEIQRERVLFLVYLLWDAGMKTGYAVRTPRECVEDARADMTIRTNLLEARFVCGDEGLFEDFSHRYEDFKAHEDVAAFVKEKLRERDERHKRTGRSQYMLEPDLKEGCGGLRDLHLLFWLFKYVFGITDMREASARGILSDKTVDLFLKAHAFLDTLRCCLHFYRGRRGDILTMDAQQAIAKVLEYDDRKGGLSAVERLMKHYYIVSKTVGALSKYFTAAVQDALSGGAVIGQIDGEDAFCLENGRIAFKRGAFVSAADLLKLFWLMHKTGAEPAPDALQTVVGRVKEIRAIRKLPQARAMFFDILLSERAQSVLHAMLDTGALCEMIPVFKRISGQMQFDMYHVYTTDEHTLKALEFLQSAEQTSDAPFVQTRRALHVAVLLHDIGKGAGGNHAEKGAVLAQKTLNDLGLDDAEKEIVVWLIRNHLLMSEVAFKRDIYDPKTVEGFVEKVASPERLRLLYALTAADIKAVGPAVWNGFKARLLSDLFKRALAAMRGDNVGQRLVSAFQKDLVARFRDSGEKAYFCARNDVLPEMTEFTVVAKDRAGLFASICGAMAVVGVSIVGATVMTLDDVVADTFYVQDTDGALLGDGRCGALKSEKKTKRLKDKILAALDDSGALDAEVSQKRLSSAKKPFYYPLKISIDNNQSDSCTLIEIDGSDCVGFLYAVAGAMTKADLQIDSAHIYTYGTHVVDVFYVKTAAGGKIAPDDADGIKRELSGVMERLNL